MNILITGCAGFIGFHLCRKLLTSKKKTTIIGIDNLNDYYSVRYKNERLKILKKFKNFKFNKLDVSDLKKIDKIFKNYKIDLIINLAAQAGVRFSISNPREYINSNVIGFFNIIELSRKYGVKKIFYASSSSVYGERKKFPLSENDTLNPKNVYSLSKRTNENLAEIYSNFYNLNFVGLRFFTIYGEWGRPDMLILKYIISTLNKKVFYLNNFGNHYRDFTYIDDAVNAIIKLINTKHRTKNEIYNICSNNPINIKKILNILNLEFGKPKIKKVKKQNADVFKTHGNNLKLKKSIKIKSLTSISDGLNNLIDWTKKNIHLFKKKKYK